VVHRHQVRLLGLVSLVWLLALCPLLRGQTANPPQQIKPVVQSPVTVNGKALFSVQGVLSFSAEARAAAITQRIKELSENVSAQANSLSIADAEGSSDIVAGDLVLMSVTEQDARAVGKSRQELAVDYKARIAAAIVALQHEYSAKSLMLGGVYTVAATLGLILIFALLRFVFPRIYRRIDAGRGTLIPSLRIQQFELLPADRIADFAIGLAKLFRLAITLVVLYFYASLVLGFFPWTRGYAGVLLGYVLSPLKTVGETLVGYLPNIFFIAVIAAFAYYAIKLTRVIFTEIGKQTISIPSFHFEWAEPTYKIARFLILVLAVIVVFPYLPGAKSPAFQGISIFIGVLFSLGSTSAVANIVAGIILTYMRAFKLGDRVQIVDTVGDVIEVSLLVTRIRTIKNVEITIANSMVLGSHIINFSASARHQGLILHTEVTIGYDAPWRTVHELLISAALDTENVLTEPRPFVFQTALDDFYVHYELNAYTDQPGRMARTYSDLHTQIQEKFNEAGVEIMSPHYATVRDGNRIAIPDAYVTKDYVAPSFRFGLGGVGDVVNNITNAGAPRPNRKPKP
jgi:small-conductance mechanosensitive channel